MPIRLNLLAEAQAAELLRRRDPVKRAIWVAALIIVLMLFWSSSLQFKAMLANSNANRLESIMKSRSGEYQKVLDNEKSTADVKEKLDALRQLNACRVLNGSLLNALQHTTVADVQLFRLRTEQLYSRTEGTKARTNENKIVIKGKPATATEKIVITVEGIDGSQSPGDQVPKFKEALADNDFFKQALVATNGVTLKSLAPPQISPATGKPSVGFALECRYPDKTR